MAFNLNYVYPANSDTDADYPIGKARNESYSGAKDYFPLEQTWVNELLGFFGSIVDQSGMTPNNLPENKNNSQYLDALQTLPVNMSRLTAGSTSMAYGKLTIGNSTLGTTSFGVAGTSDPSEVITIAPNTKANVHRVRMMEGGLGFWDSPGTNHNIFHLLYYLSSGDVTFTSGMYTNRIDVATSAVTGLNYTYVYNANLTLKSSTNMVVFPLFCNFTDSGGSLVFSSGYCNIDSGFTYNPSNYTTRYLSMVVASAAIS